MGWVRHRGGGSGGAGAGAWCIARERSGLVICGQPVGAALQRRGEVLGLDTATR